MSEKHFETTSSKNYAILFALPVLSYSLCISTSLPCVFSHSLSIFRLKMKNQNPSCLYFVKKGSVKGDGDSDYYVFIDF